MSPETKNPRRRAGATVRITQAAYRARIALCHRLCPPCFDREASLLVDVLTARVEALEAQNRRLKLRLELGGDGQ